MQLNHNPLSLVEHMHLRYIHEGTLKQKKVSIRATVSENRKTYLHLSHFLSNCISCPVTFDLSFDISLTECGVTSPLETEPLERRFQPGRSLALQFLPIPLPRDFAIESQKVGPIIEALTHSLTFSFQSAFLPVGSLPRSLQQALHASVILHHAVKRASGVVLVRERQRERSESVEREREHGGRDSPDGRISDRMGPSCPQRCADTLSLSQRTGQTCPALAPASEDLAWRETSSSISWDCAEWPRATRGCSTASTRSTRGFPNRRLFWSGR